MSHISPDFIPVLGDSIRMTRQVVCSTDGQPFLISGSGTLGWDQVSSNLIEPGEKALVLHTGYFGDSFQECLQTYGAQVTQLKAEIGGVVSETLIEEALQATDYKLVVFTHVDTSTGREIMIPCRSSNAQHLF
jgi:alanine-glyoxylate transaminase/serine-glyoxylate transaminase/serine-pyruvate transaminase